MMSDQYIMLPTSNKNSVSPKSKFQAFLLHRKNNISFMPILSMSLNS